MWDVFRRHTVTSFRTHQLANWSLELIQKVGADLEQSLHGLLGILTRHENRSSNAGNTLFELNRGLFSQFCVRYPRGGSPPAEASHRCRWTMFLTGSKAINIARRYAQGTPSPDSKSAYAKTSRSIALTAKNQISEHLLSDSERFDSLDFGGRPSASAGQPGLGGGSGIGGSGVLRKKTIYEDETGEIVSG